MGSTLLTLLVWRKAATQLIICSYNPSSSDRHFILCHERQGLQVEARDALQRLLVQYPVLETTAGQRIAEREAIAKYLANGSQLYPIFNSPINTTRASIDQWIDWGTGLSADYKTLIYPLLGELTI